MNYQHAYHVGHVADVFKHIVILQLLNFLQKKTTPLCYLETHAAKALYDLNDVPTQKSREYEHGILKLWNNPTENHPAIKQYIDIIRQFNDSEKLSFYPGSSLIARQVLREHDEAILCELHPTIYQMLRQHYSKDKKVHTHHGNGYQIITSLIPPVAKRGLVLIDPPYEIKDENQQLLNALVKMYARWPQGVYAIWFPIKQEEFLKKFYQDLNKLKLGDILLVELRTVLDDPLNTSLRGSAMIIINPPWQFNLLLTTLMPQLITALEIDKSDSARYFKIIQT